MADVRPLRGTRYDAAVVGDLATVVSPPYDVIDDPMRDALYSRSPYNFVRIDFARPQDGDPYAGAAASFRKWIEDGVLLRDEEPCYYVYEQTFDVAPGERVTRRGFLGRVRLHDYDERIILPHERTLSGPKEDRMRLMIATEAQLSQLFLLYDDPARAVDDALAAAREPAPFFDATTDDGIHHRLWRVTDPATQEQVTAAFASQRLLIADGHHRYETALAYRDAQRAAGRGPGPHDFALAYFANAADPGLIVWPTHRALFGLSDFDVDRWLAAVGAIFDVEPVDSELDARALEAKLAASGAVAPSFLALARRADGTETRALLRLAPDRAAAALSRLPGPEAARQLDVTILHSYVLPELTGISLAAQAAKTNIHYIKGLDAALEAVADPQHHVVLLMNPLPVPLVRAVCESGGFMPQKSTFFYPKVLSGIVVNDLRGD
ncbi:MAG: DUF1015 domain-containing protein [Myxococcales bacterium]|nr:DUF1015 domain-containing protein [Myxococcales bacterium]MCB9521582.1 DUF1015 domain-containing protein [Myxococcales bacterium]MCB9530578.1 DUF1015 domain-containing protein [Myxococcales bacterium]